MAKKYKISKFNISKPAGYSDGAGNETTTGALTITPDPGYCVVAADFSLLYTPPEIQSVVFANTSTVVTSHGDAGNKVTATFTFKQDYVFPSGEVKIHLPIKGKARPLSRSEKQTVSWEFNVVRATLPTANYTWSFNPLPTSRKLTSFETNDVLSTIRPGYKETRVKGYSDPSESARDAVVMFYIQPSTGYKFVRKPYLKITNPVSGKIKLYTGDYSETVALYPDLFYSVIFLKASDSVNFSDGVEVEFICETVAKKVPTRVIKTISIGSIETSFIGEERSIKISATKDSEFKVVATRGSTGKSILSRPNSTCNDSFLGEIPANYYSMTKDGVVSTNIKIPSNQILVTKVNGAVTTSSTVTLDSVQGVMKGDKITQLDKTHITSAIIREVLSVNSAANQVTLDANISIDDDKLIVFSRADKYYIDVIPYGDIEKTTFSSNIPDKQQDENGRDYLHLVEQFTPPTLLFTWTKGGLGGSITLPSTVTVVGKANTSNRNLRVLASSGITWNNETGAFRMLVRFLIAAPHGFGAPIQPVFSNKDATISHWTNSIASSNGGTEVSIYSTSATRSTSSTTNDTLDVLVYGNIKKWGNRDVEMEFDLDQITAIYVP